MRRSLLGPGHTIRIGVCAKPSSGTERGSAKANEVHPQSLHMELFESQDYGGNCDPVRSQIPVVLVEVGCACIILIELVGLLVKNRVSEVVLFNI